MITRILLFAKRNFVVLASFLTFAVILHIERVYFESLLAVKSNPFQKKMVSGPCFEVSVECL